MRGGDVAQTLLLTEDSETPAVRLRTNARSVASPRIDILLSKTSRHLFAELAILTAQQLVNQHNF